MVAFRSEAISRFTRWVGRASATRLTSPPASGASTTKKRGEAEASQEKRQYEICWSVNSVRRTTEREKKTCGWERRQLDSLDRQARTGKASMIPYKATAEK